ncbi:MAG TPA: signal peptide peptidase SppA [Opitutaceae bacterium]|nr:signal peptide peptidase SppA [Opitutaceae bacterium]
MKNFITSLLGALSALILFFIGGTFLLFVFAMILAAASSEKPATFERGSYLVFNTAVNITDTPPPFNPAAFMRAFTGDNEVQTLQLRQVTHALRAAATDSRIAGVYLTGNLAPSGYGTGYAALKEVREALEAIKAAGKPVVAYIDFATTKDMYLDSVASELVLDPFGLIAMPGLAVEPMFFAGTFEKYGVGIQVTRHGKYKSYVEPFTRRDMSPENREQTQKLLDDVWGSLVQDVAKSRGLTPVALQNIVDSQGIVRADAAAKQKFVSRVAYRDEIIEELKARTGRKGSKESFKQVALADYVNIVHDDRPEPRTARKTGGHSSSGGKIAVVYAEGAIVDGRGQIDEVGGERFSREIRRFRLDEDVKAIVLRVNSPGGSVTASEQIQREIRLTKSVKPVIVSMGSYAASGGYWISTHADHIFAEPTTITGSIGVFGILFDVQKLTSDFGLSFDRVKTGKYADLMTISRPKTPEELAVYQSMVDWAYNQFIGRVADGRKLDRAKVEDIAQGRVWSGAEAVKLGLVDELGGLDAAIRYAAKEGGLSDRYRIVEYPRKLELADIINEAMQGPQHPASARGGLVDKLTTDVKQQARYLEQFNDRQGVYARLPIEMTFR